MIETLVEEEELSLAQELTTILIDQLGFEVLGQLLQCRQITIDTQLIECIQGCIGHLGTILGFALDEVHLRQAHQRHLVVVVVVRRGRGVILGDVTIVESGTLTRLELEGVAVVLRSIVVVGEQALTVNSKAAGTTLIEIDICHIGSEGQVVE